MNKKIFLSVGVAIAILTTQAGIALAAPAIQESTPITGEVQSVVITTDSVTGEKTVAVTLLDETGATQIVNLTVDNATSLGLVTLDLLTGEPVVNDAATGQPLTIDPAMVIGAEGDDESQHPVGLALSEFFGVDYDTIMTTHEEGVGFGVIAQALWMSDGDPEMFDIIVEAKITHAYSALTLPDGSTPSNWGQFKKAVGEHGDKLGPIMSGRAENDEAAEAEGTSDHGHQNNGIHGQDHGNGNGHGHGNGHKK